MTVLGEMTKEEDKMNLLKNLNTILKDKEGYTMNLLDKLKIFLKKQKQKALIQLMKLSVFKGNLWNYLFERYFWPICFVVVFSIFSVALSSSSLRGSSEEAPVSLDQMVPKGFVLVPLEISNGEDLFSFIGAYAVVDLYLDSKGIGLPEQQVASQVRIFPPQTEEGLWTALIPEKEVIHLFEYVSAFYAVIQNPEKKNSKIYKKQKRSSLIVIEENF